VDVIHTVAELRQRLGAERAIALVPTMGNLHAGHLSLVEIAAKRGRCIVATIFVNRLQFAPDGDFERYPRTLDRDCDMLEDSGCHVTFAPDEKEMYPHPQEIRVTPPKVAQTLEGEFRRGHFEGVTTVVSKLFNIVAPQVAIFGKKDYQQLLVLRELEKQLNFGIDIVAAETVRESDGLAMSSRNGYLSAQDRAKAPQLQRELRAICERVAAGSHRHHRLDDMAAANLSMGGWKVDYIAIRRRADLAEPHPNDRELVVLGAAWLGKTRLIDNLEIDVDAP
jgi:pantoate--beta-alanine ligase